MRPATAAAHAPPPATPVSAARLTVPYRKARARSHHHVSAPHLSRVVLFTFQHETVGGSGYHDPELVEFRDANRIGSTVEAYFMQLGDSGASLDFPHRFPM